MTFSSRCCRVSSTAEGTLSVVLSLVILGTILFYSPLWQDYSSSFFHNCPDSFLWPGGRSSTSTRGPEWFPIRFRQRDTILFLFFFSPVAVSASSSVWRVQKLTGGEEKEEAAEQAAGSSSSASRCLKRINRWGKWAKSDSTRLLLRLPIKRNIREAATVE
jgi:hypothetical protein